jgi:membrane protein DedA with SNARE-associated domain
MTLVVITLALSACESIEMLAEMLVIERIIGWGLTALVLLAALIVWIVFIIKDIKRKKKGGKK